MSHRFHVWDAATVEDMVSFPLHRFDTPPIAFVPIHSSSGERFVVSVEADGNISCVSPRIHTIHSSVHLVDEDDSKEAILSALAVHQAELCLVLWCAASYQYTAHFLRAQHAKMIPIGAAPLASPDPSSCLCGVAHLGAAVCAVWSEGDVHYYTPPKKAQAGLVLSRTYKLNGFDFLAMKRRAGTEDLRKLAGGLSVCSHLNVPGVICIMGPQSETLKLKYVVLDVAAGVVRESGILDPLCIVDAPLKMVPDFSTSGMFCLFVGEEQKGGVHRMKLTPTTLATRIGIKSRKRKMSETTEMHDGDAAENTAEVDAILQHPEWSQHLNAPKARKKSRLTRRTLKKICRIGQEMNGKISPDVESFDKRMMKCVKNLHEALEVQQYRIDLADEVMHLLKEWKDSQTVLLLDIPGITSEWISTCSHNWTFLRDLFSIAPPRSLNSCPHLPTRLLEAHQFDLFAMLLANVEEIHSDQMSHLLPEVLHHSIKPQGLTAQANALDRIHASLRRTLEDVETMEDVPKDEYERLKWHIAAVQRFSMMEILLHSVVACPMDRSELQSPLEMLDRPQLRCIMLYLQKWFRILYAEMVAPSAIESVEGIRRLPSMQNIIDWLSTILTFHTATILSDTSLHQVP